MPSLSGYPAFLPSNTKVGSIRFNPNSVYAYSASTDIVWSFEYNLCGSGNFTEGGFTTFLIASPPRTTAATVLTGGNVGIDLGYSGVSGGGYTPGFTSGGLLSTTTFDGLLSAVLGIGFDTTGLFALSASNGSYTRDGVAVDKTNKNSLIVRGGWPSYNLLYNAPLSSISNLNILDNTGTIFNQLRFRLGNVGRNLYVDYRPLSSTTYTNILNLPVNLNITDNTYYYIGVSFASPISSVASNATSVFKIKNLHIEGNTAEPAIYNVATGTSQILIGNLITEIYTVTGIPPLTGYTYLNGQLSGLLDILLQTATLTGSTIYDTASGTVIYV